MFPHANSQWHWGRFAKWNAKRGADHEGIGILLQTLCVVDVDCMGVAKELEVRFPFLRLVPAEKTRKGVHYFFRRTTLADKDGYYDSRSPVIKSVDFKTVTSTGTSGFVVTAPSPGKTWIRPIWEYNELPEIPDDILRAVAAPAHESIDVAIRCADGMFHVRSCRFARMSPYMSMFGRSGFSDTRGAVQLTAYSWAVVSEAFDSLESGVVDLESESVHDIFELYDYIGIPARLVDSIKQDSAEIHRISGVQPMMAIACRAFRAVAVDRDLSRNLFIQRNDLAKKYQVFNASECEQEGKSLKPDPAQAFADCLPQCVSKWMRTYPGKLVAAGGFVLGAVANGVPPGTDVDLYVVAQDESEANAIVHHIAQDCETAVYTGYALTVTHRESDVDIQLILVLNNTAADIISGFDLHPCQVMAMYNDADGFAVTASATWVEALRNRCYPIHSGRWTDSSTLRIAKYCAKGFMAYVPGLCREKIRDWTARHVCIHTFRRAEHVWQSSLLQATGIEQLFITECYLKRLGYTTLDQHVYWHLATHARYMRKSDYHNYVKKAGIWTFIVDAVTRYCTNTKHRTWFNEYAPDKRIFWRTFHFKTKVSAINMRDSNIEKWIVMS